MQEHGDRPLGELLRTTESALRAADAAGLADAARHLDAARIAISRAIDPASSAGTLDDLDYLPAS